MPRSATEPTPGRTGRIERRPLSAQLADRIRSLILEGDYEPGQRLQEKELSETFGVSRTPLREALKVLSSEGLVTLAPNRGATITQLTDEELAETFPVMGVLEGLAGELACRNATDEEITAIGVLHARMVESYQARELASYYDFNRQIHAQILAAARNATLKHQTEQLAGRVRRARFRGAMSEQRWSQAVAEHEQILRALKSRDGAALADVLRRHVDTKFETVREHLAE
ncbi:MAG: GntR family transcriptional regulator [Hyphomicrobiaceae bacterium]